MPCFLTEIAIDPRFGLRSFNNKKLNNEATWQFHLVILIPKDLPSTTVEGV